MLKLKFISASICCVLVIFSCSPDTDNARNSQPSVFSSYVITSIFNSGQDGLEYRSVITATMSGGKLHTEKNEKFIGGQSQGATASQVYYYTGNRLTKSVHEGTSKFYFYNEGGELVALTWHLGSEQFQYYRFIHNEATVHFERLSLPFDDPATEIFRRYIITFDANDNLISAGKDLNLDGVAENIMSYTYSGGNLTSVQSGTDTTMVSYSGIKDNFTYLYDESFGKKFMRITCAELYVHNQWEKLNQSHNISESEFLTSNYEVAESGFYTKKTQVLTESDGAHTITTEFFFN